MMITATEPPPLTKSRLTELKPSSPPYSSASISISTANSVQTLFAPISPSSSTSSMSPNPYPTSGAPTSVAWSSPGEVPVDLTAALKGKEFFPARKQREFIPDAKKDDSYWDRRRRNNEAAKRSREKRRLNDMVLETRMIELTKENALLRAELVALRDKFSLPPQSLVTSEQMQLHLPCPPVEVRNRRSKLLSSLMPNGSMAAETGMMNNSSGLLSHSHVTNGGSPEHQVHPMMPHLHMMDPVQWQECHENALKESQHHQALLMNHQQHQHHLHQQVIQRLAANGNINQSEFDHNHNHRNHQEIPSPRASPRASPNAEESWSSADEPLQVQVHQHHCLPLKLRHKTLISDKDAYVPVPSYPDSGRSSAREDTSSDGDSSTGHGKESPVPKLNGGDLSPDSAPPRKMPRLSRRSKGISSELQTENLHLRFELKKLASEVAGLKDMLLCNRPSPIDIQNTVDPSKTPPHSNRTSPNLVEIQEPQTVD
ncbi:nuclear factor interleukin-3-regulated protein-like [Uloborus diversus]|uniref:nuclear factor interleukin-3-regulated protein-like n=1 Tax=Uloborus diversus TaxID=327109 RepID=UPI00240A1CD9|nr:nuclear factor interleukin-3-regulated protein-like [Uloborus diversus]XP_054717052.1 nuclear factor interleukin-3-regulated protein-like [Uloborus diversus]